MYSELHMIIIWAAGRQKEQEIIDDLRHNFEVLEVKEIEWRSENFVKNLSRFYGAYFKKDSIDVLYRRNDSFLVITFMDHSPKYDIALTSSGHALVNINVLYAKNRYRNLVNNEFAIHSTVTVLEIKHDIALLFGKNYKDYMNCISSSNKDGAFKCEKDLVGVNGWKSIEQIFYVFNECINYTLLRDFEAFPDGLGTVSDIDILVDDFALERLPFILNAKAIPDSVMGTFMFNVGVNNRTIAIHVHSFSYLSPKWVMDILNSKILNKYNLYVPDLENQFYSLYYQLIYNKSVVKKKYKNFLFKTYGSLFPEAERESNNFDNYIKNLNQFILRKGYFCCGLLGVRPNPLEFLDIVRKNIECFGITNIKPYKIDLWKSDKGIKLFTGILNDKQKVFIKYFGTDGILKKEFKILEFLQNSIVKTPKPFFYRSLRAGHQVLVSEYVEASSIADVDFNLVSENDKKTIIIDICNAVEYFNFHGLIHRDIDPSNILIDGDFNVYIIDYEYMIDTKNVVLDVNIDFTHSLDALYNLGVPNNFGVLKWNDAYSAMQIIKSFEPGFHEKYPFFYEKLNKIIKNENSTYILNKKTAVFIKKKIKYKLATLLRDFSPAWRYISNKINV